jgi:MoaA/NifB/PqqE/SkfB family radical SAM enzyme
MLPNTPYLPLETKREKGARLIKGWEKRRLRLKMLAFLFQRIYQKLGSFSKSAVALRRLRAKHQRLFGQKLFQKVWKFDGRYYFHLGAPGIPSPAMARILEDELNRVMPYRNTRSLRLLFLAITKRCPMQCEHCFEAENLNQKDVLSRDDIREIVHKYQDFGLSILWFSGGEPMLRLPDILAVLEESDTDSTDFWIITSGYRFNQKAARQLKSAGLRGLIVSLDHHKAEEHNRFRGFPHAYEYALNAVRAGGEAGLLTALSLCATNSFLTEANFHSYVKLARSLGVAFVQILEPKASGAYRGQNVALTPDKVELLGDLYLRYNTRKRYADFPIIDYLDFHARRVGCNGAGNRFLYIDPDGYVQVCPFCKNKSNKALAFSVNDSLQLAKELACDFHEKSLL